MLLVNHVRRSNHECRVLVGPTGMLLQFLAPKDEDGRHLSLQGYPERLAEGLLDMSMRVDSDYSKIFVIFSDAVPTTGLIVSTKEGSDESWVILKIEGNSASKPFRLALREEEAMKLGQTIKDYWIY